MHLSQLLEEKLIPWSLSAAAGHIITAQQKMSESHLPSGIDLTLRKIPGKRVIIKSGRVYGNTRIISAQWPDAGMHEVDVPRFIGVVSGQVNFQVSNYILGCGEGNFILIPPRLPHPGNKHSPQLISPRSPTKECTLLWMSPYKRGLQCWLTQYQSNQRTGSAAENYLFLNGQLIQLFHLLIEEALGEKNSTICKGLMLASFTALRRELTQRNYLHPGPMVNERDSSPVGNEFTIQLKEYIQRHLNEPLTLESVAHDLFTSRAQLARRMRLETDLTFVEFLTIYRIREAQTLLRESDWTVQTIAQFVGFRSAAYFHTLFQRQTGYTPIEFRLKSRKIPASSKIDTKKKSVRR